MKILLISTSNNIKNGVGNMTHELCMFLKDKADITLLLPKDAKRYDYTAYNTEYILPGYIFNIKNKEFLRYLNFSYPKTEKFDIVHSIFEFPYAMIGAKIANKFHKPFIIGVQGTYAIKPLFEFPEKYIMKWIYNSAKTIVSASAFTKKSIIDITKTKTPIEIIHNGVNFNRFSNKPDVSDILNKYKGKKILLTVGGVKPRKGHDVVIKALGLVKKDYNDFHYLIVGPHENRDRHSLYLKELIKENDLENQVTFVGECNDEDIVKYFYACNVYIHTTRVVNWNFEGFGIVYLEAGACGKPSIGAIAGGVPDAIIHNKTGLLVPEGNIEETAKAILALLKSDELAKRLGEAGREYSRNHDWSIVGERFLELYENCYSSR